MAELKYSPLNHDHAAFLAKAQAKKATSQQPDYNNLGSAPVVLVPPSKQAMAESQSAATAPATTAAATQSGQATTTTTQAANPQKRKSIFDLFNGSGSSSTTTGSAAPTQVASAAQQTRPLAAPDDVKTLLLLPGSRRGEVSRMIEPFRQTVDILAERGSRLRLLLPTVPHVEKLVRDATAGWTTRPEIVADVDGKWRAFAEADAALCASGTVSLELALARVPLVAIYKLDMIARMLRFMITTWSASLPNLIADRVVVPEYYDDAVQPGQLARYLEALLADSSLRRWQREGFDEVWRRLATDRPSGEIAAEVVLKTSRNGKSPG